MFQFVVDNELRPERWLALLLTVMLLQEIKRSRRAGVYMLRRLRLIGSVRNHSVHGRALTNWLIPNIEPVTLTKLVDSRGASLADARNSNDCSPRQNIRCLLQLNSRRRHKLVASALRRLVIRRHEVAPICRPSVELVRRRHLQADWPTRIDSRLL